MKLNIFSLWIGCLILSGCGSKLPYQLSRNNERVVAKAAGPLTIQLPNTDEQSQDLGEGNGKPTVVFFAQELCASCAEEVAMIKSNLKAPLQNPANINVYTILLGSDGPSAKSWKEEHQVPWPVLYDIDATTIKKYCSKPVLPCVVVHTPTEGVVLVEQKVVSFEEIYKWTGPWEN